jgi:hypothetical protein
VFDRSRPEQGRRLRPIDADCFGMDDIQLDGGGKPDGFVETSLRTASRILRFAQNGMNDDGATGAFG